MAAQQRHQLLRARPERAAGLCANWRRPCATGSLPRPPGWPAASLELPGPHAGAGSSSDAALSPNPACPRRAGSPPGLTWPALPSGAPGRGGPRLQRQRAASSACAGERCPPANRKPGPQAAHWPRASPARATWRVATRGAHEARVEAATAAMSAGWRWIEAGCWRMLCERVWGLLVGATRIEAWSERRSPKPAVYDGLPPGQHSCDLGKTDIRSLDKPPHGPSCRTAQPSRLGQRPTAALPIFGGGVERL